MTTSDLDQNMANKGDELKIQQQIAFASELFKGEMTADILFESLAEGVVVVDNSGTILLVNSRAEQMFGYPKNELIGKSHTVLIPERLRKVHEDHQANFFAKPKCSQMGQRVELTGLCSDGSELPVTISLSFIENINGVFVLAFITDMTERMQAKESVIESENKFTKAFQATPSVLVIASLEDGRYMEVNEGFERVLGYQRDEVVGRSSQDFNIWQNPIDRTNVLRMLAEGKKVRDLEIGFRSKSGAILVGLYSADIIEIGAEKCLLSLVNDITSRKKMEEDLRLSEGRYRRLYNETPVMLHSIDPDGRLVSVSNYWLETLGYERSEVLGRKTTDFLTAASSSYATDIVLPDFFRTGTCKEVPYQFVKKNGEILDILLSSIAERDSEGKIVRSLAVMVDVTERKRSEEEIKRLNAALVARAAELEDTNQELEAFNYTVAHDLRQPLNIIGLNCQAVNMLCDNQLNQECRGYVQDAYNGTLCMTQLIDTLLNFSRLVHIEPHLEMVDLSALAHEVIKMLKVTDPERQVDFRIADGIKANADANLLQVVLNNLLGNAWKYTGIRKETVIQFGMTKTNEVPVYFVKDNGTGFDKVNAEKLFIPFQRLPDAEKCKGFGIGLATVERIVRHHGGKIWANGTSGKGATFYFTLSGE